MGSLFRDDKYNLFLILVYVVNNTMPHNQGSSGLSAESYSQSVVEEEEGMNKMMTTALNPKTSNEILKTTPDKTLLRDLTVDQLTPCLSRGGRISLHATDEQEVIFSYFQPNSVLRQRKADGLRDSGRNASCLISVKPTFTLRVSVHLLEQTCSSESYLAIAEASRVTHLGKLWRTKSYTCRPFLSYKPELKGTTGIYLLLRVKDFFQNFTLRVYVSALDYRQLQSGRLIYGNLSSKSGFIQLGCQFYSRKDYVVVTVPTGYPVVILSFRYLEFQSLLYSLEIAVKQGSGFKPVMTVRADSQDRSARVLSTSAFCVTFPRELRHLVYGEPSFRILFSFHQNSSLPERVSTQLWNCAVPHWEDFRHHFVCNFFVDCAGDEDETGCPYTLCFPRGILLGHSCYVFRALYNISTWTSHQIDCRSIGGHLVSLNSVQETEEVKRLLRQTLGYLWFDFIAIGLYAAGASLPDK